MAPLSKEARERLIIALTSRKVGSEVADTIDLSASIIPVDAPAPNTSLFFDGTDFLWEPASGGGGANTTLSNLDSPTNINQDLLFISTMGGPNIGSFSGGRPNDIYAISRVTVGDDSADRVDLNPGAAYFWQVGNFFGRISIENEFTPFGSDIGLALHGPANEPNINLLANRVVLGRYTPASGIDPKMHLTWNRDSNGDIGSSDDGVTKKRPRDVYIARDLFIGGMVKDPTSVQSIDVNARQQFDAAAVLSIFWDDRTAYDTTGTVSVNWGTREVNFPSGNSAISWFNENIVDILNGANLQMTGSLLWPADGTGDIGSPDVGTTAARPRNIFVKDGVFIRTLGGEVGLQIDANGISDTPDNAVDGIQALSLTIAASDKTAGNGQGGTIYLYSGNSFGGKSGDISIDASSILSTSIDGGTVGLYGGNATTGVAGNVELSAGVSTTGTHGRIILYAADLLVPHPVIEINTVADLVLGSSSVAIDTVIYGRPNTDADANKAQTLRISGHDKTTGTGDGGDIFLRPGSSAGGVAGAIFLQQAGTALIQLKQADDGLTFQGWSNSTGHSFLRTNPSATDGSQNSWLQAGGTWDPSGFGPQEGVQLGWNTINSRFELNTFFVGGVARALEIYTAGNPLQLVLATDGTVKAAGQLRAASLGVGNSAAATTLGSVTKKIEIFDASGVSLGFIPVYDSIT